MIGVGLVDRQVSAIFCWLTAALVFTGYRQVGSNFDNGRTSRGGSSSGSNTGTTTRYENRQQ